ncbi:MAG: imelysin family protein [Myxococcota bacterium]
MTIPRRTLTLRSNLRHRQWLGAASFALASFALVSFTLAACATEPGGDGAGGPSGPEVMRSTVDNTIVPDVAAFNVAAQGMQGEVDAFCAAPSPEALDGLQASWRSLSEAWNTVAAYNLGPLDDDFITPKIIFFESMRQRGIDYTQTVRDTAAMAIGGADPLDDAFFDGLTFNRVGMLALEVLVFEDSREGGSTDPADIVADYEEQARKCEYLRGIMAQIVGRAAQLDTEWNDSFAGGEAFRDTMLGTELPDGAEPVAGLLIAVQDHLLYIKERKLEGILDAQLSGHFYPNVAAMLDGLENLLVQPAPDDAVGMLDFMAARGLDDDVALVEANLAMAQTAAANEDRDALITAIGLLEGNVKREIPDGLGVELGITFSDGD